MNTNEAGAPTLVIFCRRPSPGIGKQRIASVLGSQFAVDLSTHLLAAAMEDAAAWPGPVVLSPARPSDATWAGTLLSRAVRISPQPDGNLGERLRAVDDELRSGGARRLIYIGADAPLLDYAYYARARIALDQADVVLGPAEDGGVTLMGSRCPWPELADLPWSTSSLGESLERRCRARGLAVETLASAYDVDEADQLTRLHADLRGDLRPARIALRRWLAAAI